MIRTGLKAGYTTRAMSYEGVNAVMCRSNLWAEQPFGGYNIITVDRDSVFLQDKMLFYTNTAKEIKATDAGDGTTLPPTRV